LWWNLKKRQNNRLLGNLLTFRFLNVKNKLICVLPSVNDMRDGQNINYLFRTGFNFVCADECRRTRTWKNACLIFFFTNPYLKFSLYSDTLAHTQTNFICLSFSHSVSLSFLRSHTHNTHTHTHYTRYLSLSLCLTHTQHKRM